MSQRTKFYLSFFSINGLAYLHIYLAEYPNPFIVLGVALPIPILSAWVSWKISRFEVTKSNASVQTLQGTEMQFELYEQGVESNKPLIYMWEINDSKGSMVGRYVGKAKNGSKRPIKHYRRNVERLLAGKPYRKSNPDGFRKVHRALAEAVSSGYEIKLFFLTNVACEDDINEVEASLIKAKNCKGGESWQLNG